MASPGARDVRRAVESVELKFLVAESEHRTARDALGIDLQAAVASQVYYLDTPGLALMARSVVLRARHDAAVSCGPSSPPSFQAAGEATRVSPLRWTSRRA